MPQSYENNTTPHRKNLPLPDDHIQKMDTRTSDLAPLPNWRREEWGERGREGVRRGGVGRGRGGGRSGEMEGEREGGVGRGREEGGVGRGREVGGEEWGEGGEE